MAGTRFEFGGFRFDAGARVLWRGREIVGVAPKALDLLAVLLERAGDVVTKDELLHRAWPDVVVEEANLSVNVSLLRKALGEAPGGSPWIETIPRRGYRFAGPVRAASPTPRAMAVLPFRPLGGADGDPALGLAMADAVITRLARGGEITVRPTSAVQRYVSGDVDPRAAGRALGVDVVLDGRLQREGSRLRVTAQLLPVGSDAPLWAESFDEEMSGVFALQDAVAARLAGALALERGAPARPARRPTPGIPAYEAYVRGRWFWTRFSRTWLAKAVGAFVEASELDPSFALPHAGLADASLVSGLAGLLRPLDAWTAAARRVEQALALDDGLPEAHVSRGWVLLFRDWDWAGADAALSRAAALDPHSAAVLQWRGLFETLRGDTAAAERALAAARVVDPLSLVGSAVEGFRRGLTGDHEGELAQQRRTVELDPNQFLGHWALGTAFQNRGRHAEAAAAHRQALELSEGAPMMRPVLARSLALEGRADEARALLAPAAADVLVSPYQEATVLVALGEREAALERLRAACDARDPWAVVLPVDPMLRPLHGYLAFRELAARVRE